MGIFHSAKKIDTKKREKRIQLKNYSYSDATHFLECVQCIGRNRMEYLMNCTLISIKNGKAKVVVYGDRNKKFNYTPHIRYVDQDRLKTRESVLLN